MITIVFHSESPLYNQIYTHFKEQILKNHLQVGYKLPSTRTLSNHLGVSLNRVKLAYNQLLEEGFIVSKERSGYFVDLLKPVTKSVHSKIQKEGTQAKKQKIKYNFSYGEVDAEKMPMSLLKNAYAQGLDRAAREGSSPKGGIYSLRSEISKYLYARRGVDISPDNTIITSGFSENLLLLLFLLDNPYFALEDPGYSKSFEVISRFSKKLISIPIDKYGFSVKDLENTSGNIPIVTPNHQFPTGIIMGLRRRQRLLAWAEEKENRFIVEDDYDSDFKYVGKPIPALKSLDTKGKVILSGSFSQSIGPFLGISYLVLPDQLIEKWKTFNLPMAQVSLLHQYTLDQFLQSGVFEKHLDRMNTYYKKKRNTLVQCMKQYEGVEILGAEAGLHFIVRVDKDHWVTENFRKKAREMSVKIQLISDFSNQWQPFDLIIGFGPTPMDTLEESVKYLFETLLVKKEKL